MFSEIQKMRCAGLVLLLAAVTCASAQDSPLLGDWLEPGGSIVRIEHCGGDLCMRLHVLGPNEPGTTDARNPDASLRSRALCGLEIGRAFHMDDATHASQGWLYDPRSGNTYHGKMALEGDALKLRGYVGISLLGRTETWHRARTVDAPCHAAAK